MSNLVSGALVLPVLFWDYPLALLFDDEPPSAWILWSLGATWVVLGSVYLALVYARDALSTREEARGWIRPWLVAVALLTVMLLASIYSSDMAYALDAGAYLTVFYGALVIATPCYAAWQLVALGIWLVLWPNDPRSNRQRVGRETRWAVTQMLVVMIPVSLFFLGRLTFTVWSVAHSYNGGCSNYFGQSVPCSQEGLRDAVNLAIPLLCWLVVLGVHLRRRVPGQSSRSVRTHRP